MSNATVLVVEHEPIAPAGWLGEWLEAGGLTLDVRRPYRGDRLPADLAGHAALLVLGGSMGAEDDADHPWLTGTKQLLRTAAAEQVPALGVCLGHQLAAVAFGGAVAVNPRGQQVGVVPVGWLPAAYDDPLLGPLTEVATRAVMWNNDVVTTLPEGGTALARTPAGELQAARYAPTVWGVQWHPEVDTEIVRVWAEHDREAAAARGVDVAGHLAAVAAAEPELRTAWRGLADGLVRLSGGVRR